jgi:hypothetical protein
VSQRYESLDAFDAAAKAQERERFFQARLLVRELPIQGLKIVFSRGAGRSALPAPARREIYERETEAPEWVLAAPELLTLAQVIERKVPDEDRVLILAGELVAGSWEVRYGKDLCHSESDESLASVVRSVLASLQD